MTPDEIRAAAVAHIGHDGPIVSFTLARWATYPDPAELPPGWRAAGGYATDTGLRQMAASLTGELFSDTPRRLEAFHCSAGFTHWRYWRSLHHPNRRAMAACLHSATPEPLRP